MAFTQYIGNNDYRGYLNYLSKNSNDPTIRNPAGTLLNLVGNDAKFGNNYNAGSDLAATNQRLYQQYQSLNAGAPPNIGSIYGSGGGGGAAPVYAPKLDVASINAQARAAAENAVNPFYTKQLNDFLAQQGALKQQRQTQYSTDIANYQQALKDTLEANQVNQQRTAEDAALKQENINTTNDQSQVDTGTQFEDARLAAARQQAAQGVLGTGAGNRQTLTQTVQRNTTEGRANQDFQQQRSQTEQFKNRTFEDIAKSNENANLTDAQKEKQAKFDLDSYIQNAGFQEQAQRNQLEEQRLQRVGQEQGNQAKLLFNNYLAGIKDPAQYEAAVRTYGGSF